MLRLGGRQAVRGRFLGSWDSPSDESSLPGGTINGSCHFFRSKFRFPMQKLRLARAFLTPIPGWAKSRNLAVISLP